MKKMIVLVTVLFAQVFFISGSVQCADISSVEDGKGNLFPANNDEK